jgi:hypothetical protein
MVFGMFTCPFIENPDKFALKRGDMRAVDYALIHPP